VYQEDALNATITTGHYLKAPTTHVCCDTPSDYRGFRVAGPVRVRGSGGRAILRTVHGFRNLRVAPLDCTAVIELRIVDGH
jgi:hypothetical protein